MANYRSVKTSIWEEPWFERLDPNTKFTYLYLITNSKISQSGLIKITIKKISYEIGLEIEVIDKSLVELTRLSKIAYTNDYIWLKNFTKNNAHNEKFLKPAILEIFESYPELLEEWLQVNAKIIIQYQEKLKLMGIDIDKIKKYTHDIPMLMGIDMDSIGIPNKSKVSISIRKDKDKDKEKEKEKEKESEEEFSEKLENIKKESEERERLQKDKEERLLKKSEEVKKIVLTGKAKEFFDFISNNFVLLNSDIYFDTIYSIHNFFKSKTFNEKYFDKAFEDFKNYREVNPGTNLQNPYLYFTKIYLNIKKEAEKPYIQ